MEWSKGGICGSWDDEALSGLTVSARFHSGGTAKSLGRDGYRLVAKFKEILQREKRIFLCGNNFLEYFVEQDVKFIE